MDLFDDDPDSNDEEDLENFNLSISTDLTNLNYEKAGELVKEEANQISFYFCSMIRFIT